MIERQRRRPRIIQSLVGAVALACSTAITCHAFSTFSSRSTIVGGRTHSTRIREHHFRSVSKNPGFFPLQCHRKPSRGGRRASNLLLGGVAHYLSANDEHEGTSSKGRTTTSHDEDEDAAGTKSSSRWTRWWTGVAHPQRPDWAQAWMPTGLVRLRPSLQLVTVLVAYIFHMLVLSRRAIVFPYQLIPNERGHFQSIGWDSIAGIMTMVGYYLFRRTVTPSQGTSVVNEEARMHLIPKLWSTPSLSEMPWKTIYRSKYSRITSFLALCALIQAYFWTGKLSLWWEDAFYYLANFYPITVAMHRSLCVLFGHLSWIVLGGSVLRLIPRPQSFFEGTWYTQRYRKQQEPPSIEDDGGDTTGAASGVDKNPGAPQWVWWTIGGYFVSSWLFNIADIVNQWVLPVSILEQAQESVVSQLINPESNDWWASLVGYIAPCITAPWWEEVLYRGFLLPALVLQMKYKWAILWSGIIFAVHHLSPTACIPLTILGWTWSILYTKSGNLLTTILIHAMWNSRIFLGSWFGL